MRYLYIARLLGIAGIVWLYYENELNGWTVVMVGVPVSALAGEVIAWRVMRVPAKGVKRLSLLEPLLDANEVSLALQEKSRGDG